MYAEGSEDLPRDYTTAKSYFQRAIDMVCTNKYDAWSMLFTLNVHENDPYSIFIPK